MLYSTELRSIIHALGESQGILQQVREALRSAHEDTKRLHARISIGELESAHRERHADQDREEALQGDLCELQQERRGRGDVDETVGGVQDGEEQ